MATIAAIRSAALDVFLAPKTQAAVTAVAGLDANSCFINEFHTLRVLGNRNEKPRCGGAFYSCSQEDLVTRISRQSRSYNYKLHHVNKLAVFRPFSRELDLAIFFRKQGVIAANANVNTRMKMRATLTNNYITGNHFLAAIDLHAQSFTL